MAVSPPQLPIIAGFHPDPSICRRGDRFYLANSSFEYRPGVPIHRSDDLVEWTLAGHALTRPDQLPPTSGAASGGIYAPTLRYHDGKFWLVTTDVDRMTSGHFIVSADDPAGPWSAAVHVSGAIGIDPDLAWDEAGGCHLTWASFSPGLSGIVSAPIDPVTGTMLDQPKPLWGGTGLASPEGPHLYQIGGYWYLMLAEGGTERGHAVTIARSTTLHGPFEPAPHNPILSHRSTALPVQNTGHADLVQCADGTWAMVYLGVRPRGQTPRFHTNGRETFLAGIDWVDDWPVVREDRYASVPADHSFADRFESPQLDLRWVSPGVFPDEFATLKDDGLRLRAPSDGDSALLVTRVVDHNWSAEATIDATAGRARLVLRIDEDHWYGLTIDRDTVSATWRIGPAETVVASRAATGRETLRIRVHAPEPRLGRPKEPDIVELAIVGPAGTEVLAAADGRYLSTEVAGGFTGRVVGVEVLSDDVIVESFVYRTE